MAGARPLSRRTTRTLRSGRDMAARVEGYRAELRVLKDWEPYLRKHSGLPGARANLELVEAVGEEADADRLWRLSASSDEFLALCGTAGLRQEGPVLTATGRKVVPEAPPPPPVAGATGAAALAPP